METRDGRADLEGVVGPAPHRRRWGIFVATCTLPSRCTVFPEGPGAPPHSLSTAGHSSCV